MSFRKPANFRTTDSPSPGVLGEDGCPILITSFVPDFGVVGPKHAGFNAGAFFHGGRQLKHLRKQMDRSLNTFRPATAPKKSRKKRKPRTASGHRVSPAIAAGQAKTPASPSFVRGYMRGYRGAAMQESWMGEHFDGVTEQPSMMSHASAVSSATSRGQGALIEFPSRNPFRHGSKKSAAYYRKTVAAERHAASEWRQAHKMATPGIGAPHALPELFVAPDMDRAPRLPTGLGTDSTVSFDLGRMAREHLTGEGSYGVQAYNPVAPPGGMVPVGPWSRGADAPQVDDAEVAYSRPSTRGSARSSRELTGSSFRSDKPRLVSSSSFKSVSSAPSFPSASLNAGRRPRFISVSGDMDMSESRQSVATRPKTPTLAPAAGAFLEVLEQLEADKAEIEEEEEALREARTQTWKLQRAKSAAAARRRAEADTKYSL